MAYTFRQQLLDTKRYMYAHPTQKDKNGKPLTVYKSAYVMTPKSITVHNTANDANAEREATYHNRADNHNSTTYHIAIDDKEAVQVLPFNRNGYHAGDGSIANGGNRTSIGIEICYSKSGGERYTKAEDNAVQYIATLLKQYGWGVDRVKQHYDWSRKNCPHRIRNEGRWPSFIQRIQKALDALNKPVVAKPVTPKKVEEVNPVTTINKTVVTPVALLNGTGRDEVRKLLKKARIAEVISSSHTDAKIDGYDDVQLLSYQAAVINRTFKS